MKRFNLIILSFAAAVLLSACQSPAGNSANGNSNTSNTNAAKPMAVAPTKDALITLEKKGWEAWKNKDSKTFNELLSDKYIGFNAAGRIDKATSLKSLVDPKVVVKSYSLSDDQMTMLGPDAALLTFKAAQDFTMADGKPGPKEVWSASIYVREGDQWRSAYYNEMPVADPKAKPAAPKPAAATKPAAESKPLDAATEALLVLEKKGWEAWKARDAKGVEGLYTKDFAVLDSGQRFDAAGAMKLWFESKCEVKSYALSDAASTAFTKDMSILTYKGSSVGTCDGNPLGTIWATAVYVKDGENWKMALTFNAPI
jgi:ketosteroid isomerase-like protein